MKKNKRRKVDVVVVSDVHLGTFGCHAKQLFKYLKSVQPKTLILNGDIIDIWQFNKRYWPKSHMKVIKQIVSYLASDTQIYYITGNHDEMLRKFEGLHMGNFQIVNQVQMDLDGKKTWFFHGDVFDVVIQNSKWLAKIGGISYDFLIVLNAFINFCSNLLGQKKISLSKMIKDNVKKAVKYIGDFEQAAVQVAVEKKMDTVVCGHIHQPQLSTISHEGQDILYLNSGDWIENLTALEYHDKEWSLYTYPIKEEDTITESHDDEEDETTSILDLNHKQLLERLITEFK